MARDTPNDGTNVWRSQPAERLDLSIEEMRRKARRLETKVRWRNAREYVACALVVAAFAYYASVFHSTAVRAGCGLVVVGALFTVLRLHKTGAARPVPSELALRTCVGFQRGELERQRDLLLGVWRWYLLPFVPGLIVFLLGLFEFTMRQPHASEHAGWIVTVFALTAAGIAMVFVGVGKLNHWAARKLQREIDELDRMASEQG
jgi:hypothetical protein